MDPASTGGLAEALVSGTFGPRVDLPRETYKVSADSDDGSVDVSVPRDDASSHVVNARTQDGEVTVRTAN